MDAVADTESPDLRPTADVYRLFGQVETASSPTYTEWALSIADDPAVLALIDELPMRKRQPNLIFAAARHAGAPVGPYGDFQAWLKSHWPHVKSVALTHATQTNEAARCAILLPLLAAIPGPLALLEVGASAGFPTSMPKVTWKAGSDLNPLDVSDPEALAWLDALIWPEHDDRKARLRAAVAIAQADPPHIVPGNLLEQLEPLAASAPTDATLVVFHTAVLAYLNADERARFVQTVSDLPGHWISNEGVHVTPSVAERLAGEQPEPGEFIVAVDGQPMAFAQPHGRNLRWLDVR